MRTQIVLQTRAAQRIGRLSASIRSEAALVAAAARSVEPTARRANETAVVLPCSNSGLSVHTDPHSDGKRRLSGKLLAPLPFRHQRGETFNAPEVKRWKAANFYVYQPVRAMMGDGLGYNSRRAEAA